MNHLPSIARPRRRALLWVAFLTLALGHGRPAAAQQSGALDTSFGNGGVVTQAVGSAANEGFAVAIDGDGRILVAGYAVELKQKFAVSRFTASGAPDPSFGQNGSVIIAVRNDLDRVRALLVQDDGKILLLGHSAAGGNDDFALVRLLENGSLDTSFGVGGKVTTEISIGDDQIHAGTLQEDGKIVVAGYARVGANLDVAVARYLTTGAPDLDFGIAGKASHELGTSNDQADAVVVQPDGKIVIAGVSANGSQQRMLVARLKASGELDTSFNTTGSRRIDIGTGNSFGRGLALQPDGAILIAGYARVGTVDNIAVARVTADGALDPTFSADGMLTTAIGTRSEGHAIALHPRGRLVVAGLAELSGDRGFAVAQYRPDGSVDPTFGTAGTVVHQLGPRIDEANAVAIQDDGYVVAAGTVRNTLNLTSADFAVVRLIVSLCGDGVVDPQELCDAIEPGAGACCSSTCTLKEAGTTCRAATGLCDLAEACDGLDGECPADEWLPDGIVCRAATGDCDVQESCTGLGPQCPPNAVVPALTTCREASDACDAVEVCNGVSPACPSDQLVTAGVVCRIATDLCDAAERCSGTEPSCPEDELLPADTVCREAADECDATESCSGASAACPSDEVLPDGDEDGVCDVKDVCPEQSDPTQADGDGDGIGDACDPCTGGVAIARAVVRIANFITPDGDDTFRLKGQLHFAAPPTLEPEITGMRILLESALGETLFDVAVPPGAGWTVNRTGNVMSFRTPSAIDGLVNNVKITARRTRPGFVELKVNGYAGAFAQAFQAAPLKVTVVLDPTTPTSGVCGDKSFTGTACNLIGEGAVLFCR